MGPAPIEGSTQVLSELYSKGLNPRVTESGCIFPLPLHKWDNGGDGAFLCRYQFRVYSIQWKTSGQTLFSGEALVAQKSWMIKYTSIQWKIPGQLCFSGQAQKSWTVKKFWIQCIFSWAIRVIWASVVCNLDQSRDWL